MENGSQNQCFTFNRTNTKISSNAKNRKKPWERGLRRGFQDKKTIPADTMAKMTHSSMNITSLVRQTDGLDFGHT